MPDLPFPVSHGAAPASFLPALQMLRDGPTTVASAERYMGRVAWAALWPFVAFDPTAAAPLSLTRAGAAALAQLEAQVVPRPIPWPKALIAGNVVARPSPGVKRLGLLRLGRGALLAAAECGVLHVQVQGDQVASARLTRVGAWFRQDQPHRSGPQAVEASLARRWLEVVASVAPSSLDHVATAASSADPYVPLHWLACAGFVQLPHAFGEVTVELTARGRRFLDTPPCAPEAERAAA